MRLDPHAKLLWQGDRVSEWLKTGKTTPVLLEIAPTGYCNAHCPECFFWDKHDRDRVEGAVMLRAIEEFAAAGIQAINWTGGGEPTLHPQFGSFVAAAHKAGIAQGLFTNALREIPEQDKLEWIRVTFTDRRYAGIKKPKVPFGIVVNQSKEQTPAELRGLCEEARRMGAAYFQVRPALVGSWELQPHIEEPGYLQEFTQPGFEVYTTAYKYAEAIKPRDYNLCYGYHFCASIDWHGALGVCLYMMRDEQFVFGDLNKESFGDIWARVPGQIKVIAKCQNCCKNHEINKLLYAATKVENTKFL